ncbi:MAG: hypothetical protein ACFFC3_04305 [Candidatus Odinarchaeota archaeon]
MPVVPISPRESRQGYQEAISKKQESRLYLDKGPKTLKKYLKRQDKQRERTLRSYQTSYKGPSQYQGTKILFVMIIIFSIAALFFAYSSIPEYFYLSLYGLIYEYTYHTIFTSLFVSSYDLFSIFFLFIMLFILYFMARNIEMSLGTKFLIKLYIACCLFTALFYVLLRVSLVLIYPLSVALLPIGLAWGGILGLISYSLFPIMNKKVTAYMYFLPVRMNGKSFLLIIILLRVLPVLLLVWSNITIILIYLPDLGGILGAYVVYKYQFSIR